MRGGFRAACLAAMIAALAGAIGTVRWLEAGAGPGAPDGELRYLPSPRMARYLALGYDNLAADLMWIRTVQYFGKHIESDGRYPRLRDLLELTVGLDPHFTEAYRDGAVFLWIAGDIPGTVSLLEEGYRQNPGRWELAHDLGRLYFLQLGDYAQALRWWNITERLPDAPTYLARFIARLQGKVGNVETAIELWEAIENDPNTHEHFRTIAQQEIKRLRAQLARERRSP